MFGIILSCALSIPVSVDSMAEYISCRDTQRKVEFVSQWTPLISMYFDNNEDRIKALTIIQCESRGKDSAVGINKDGTRDVGLWQFNDNTWAWLTPKLNIKNDRYDPWTSTAVASWLVYNDGWHHWNSSKHCWGR